MNQQGNTGEAKKRTKSSQKDRLKRTKTVSYLTRDTLMDRATIGRDVLRTAGARGYRGTAKLADKTRRKLNTKGKTWTGDMTRL